MPARAPESVTAVNARAGNVERVVALDTCSSGSRQSCDEILDHSFERFVGIVAPTGSQ